MKKRKFKCIINSEIKFQKYLKSLKGDLSDDLFLKYTKLKQNQRRVVELP